LLKNRMVLVLVLIIFSMCLYGCDEELNEQDMSLVDSKVAIQQDTENKTASIYSDYKKIGEYLLKTEAVDEITIGTVATKILSKYGEPDTHTTESNHIIWAYKSVGLEFNFIENQKELQVYSIRATADFKGSTNRDIKIGSSSEQVLNAYKQEINNATSTQELIIAGNDSSGIYFHIYKNIVTSIVFGSK